MCWRADVQQVSQHPDIVSLMFLYACHIQVKMCVCYTELGNGATALKCEIFPDREPATKEKIIKESHMYAFLYEACS